MRRTRSQLRDLSHDIHAVQGKNAVLGHFTKALLRTKELLPAALLPAFAQPGQAEHQEQAVHAGKHPSKALLHTTAPTQPGQAEHAAQAVHPGNLHTAASTQSGQAAQASHAGNHPSKLSLTQTVSQRVKKDLEKSAAFFTSWLPK